MGMKSVLSRLTKKIDGGCLRTEYLGGIFGPHKQGVSKMTIT